MCKFSNQHKETKNLMHMTEQYRGRETAYTASWYQALIWGSSAHTNTRTHTHLTLFETAHLSSHSCLPLEFPLEAGPCIQAEIFSLIKKYW